MSFKTKTNSCVQLNGETIGLIDAITHCIDEDMDLLKGDIDFTQFSDCLPEMKKFTKSQTISETKIISKSDEINTKLSQQLSNDCKPIPNDHNIGSEELDFGSIGESTQRLKALFPTFKKIVNNFAEKCEKQSNNENNCCFDCKLIEVNEEIFDNCLQITQRIQDFQQLDKHLMPFNDN